MPAPTQIPSPGAADGAGDRSALFLRMFAGEVLKKLEKKLIVMGTTTVQRDLTGAKVASFPTYGDASATYHVPGDDIIRDDDEQTVAQDYLSNIKVGEHLVYADRVLQSSVLLDNLEEKLNHWDHRSRMSDKLTTAIKEQTEDNLFRLIGSASGLGTTDVQGIKLTEWDSGTNENNAGVAITAADIYAKVFKFAELLDTVYADDEGRFAACPIDLFYDTTRLTGATSNLAHEVVNRDFVGSGVNGDLARPQTMGLFIGNVFLMKTPSIPTTAPMTASAWALNSGSKNLYDDVTTATWAKNVKLMGWTKDTIGTVRVLSPRLDVNWIAQRLAHLVTVSQAVGHGVLRPETAYSFRVTA